MRNHVVSDLLWTGLVKTRLKGNDQTIPRSPNQVLTKKSWPQACSEQTQEELPDALAPDGHLTDYPGAPLVSGQSRPAASSFFVNTWLGLRGIVWSNL